MTVARDIRDEPGGARGRSRAGRRDPHPGSGGDRALAALSCMASWPAAAARH